MKFHHLGIATDDIQKSAVWIEQNLGAKAISKRVYDPNQQVTVQLFDAQGTTFELVSGATVGRFVKKKVTYYHTCYVVENIAQTIEQFSNALVISSPKEALLFDNQLVAFLMTPVGIIELLEKKDM